MSSPTTEGSTNAGAGVRSRPVGRLKLIGKLPLQCKTPLVQNRSLGSTRVVTKGSTYFDREQCRCSVATGRKLLGKAEHRPAKAAALQVLRSLAKPANLDVLLDVVRGYS